MSSRSGRDPPPSPDDDALKLRAVLKSSLIAPSPASKLAPPASRPRRTLWIWGLLLVMVVIIALARQCGG